MAKETDKNEIIPDEDLDCTGLYCPTPIFETRKKIDYHAIRQYFKNYC